MKVEEVMHGSIIWSTPDTSLGEIAKIMRDNDVGAIPIGLDGKLIGMVTDRDIVVRALADGRDVSSLTARDVMTEGVSCCRADQDLKEAIRLMEEKALRRLPVLDANSRPVGMLSLGDVSNAAEAELAGELAKSVSAHHQTKQSRTEVSADKGRPTPTAVA